jgi:ATP adenylyltransferase
MRNIAIGTQTIDAVGRGRFDNLLRGKRSDYDHVLFETHGCIVAPTLGSIIPKWLLAIPRRKAVTFREWSTTSHLDPACVIGNVLSELSIPPERAIWFEHGPSSKGSIVGCGVDYAHLHILIDAPFRFEEFRAATSESAVLVWRRTSSMKAYSSIQEVGSYLVAGSLGEAVFAEDVENVGSQFFRRVVARLVDKPDQWNYKIHAHLENVRRTVSAFSDQRALV